MSDITGPISTLPGASHKVPEGAKCDEHPDRPATRRIQGETDSFGCELIDCCDECFERIRAGVELQRVGYCDWCKKEAADLRAHRDFEEGRTGPVYMVCGPCRRQESDELAAEAAEYDDCDDFGDDNSDFNMDDEDLP